MRYAQRNVTKLALLIWLLAVGTVPAWAQNGSAVATVEQASKVLVGQLADGLGISWSGLGSVAGEMVDATVTNNSSAPMEVAFLPGMVLVDARGESQPIMLEEHVRVTLKPGESTTLSGMRAYCLDHSKEPPGQGSGVEYKVMTNLANYASAIQNLWAGLRLDREGAYTPVLKPLLHRTLVIQRSVWASLGGNNPNSQEKLTSDLEADLVGKGSDVSQQKVNWLSDKIWSDVVKTMDASGKE